MQKEQNAGSIVIAFAEGNRQVPLTKETMDTMTKYFELKNGVFYYSNKKANAYILKGFNTKNK